MGISRGLRRSARSVVDGARSDREAPRSDEPARTGAEAAYARILDGMHLWVALPAAVGRPALQDPATGALVDAAPLSADDGGPDPGYHAARWPLDDVVPAVADAELRLVAAGDAHGAAGPDRRDGPERAVMPLRPPPPAPSGSLRVPPTPDGRWRFQLVTDRDGFLRVRRTVAPRVAELATIEDLDGSARLVVRPDPTTAPPADPAPDPSPEPPEEPVLLFLDRDRRVVARVTGSTGGAGDPEVTVVVALTDLPPAPGGYRVALETAGGPVPVVRRHRDLRIGEPDTVPLPSVLDPGRGIEAGRFQFAPQGALRLVRRDPDVVAGATEATS